MTAFIRRLESSKRAMEESPYMGISNVVTSLMDLRSTKPDHPKPSEQCHAQLTGNRASSKPVSVSKRSLSSPRPDQPSTRHITHPQSLFQQWSIRPGHELQAIIIDLPSPLDLHRLGTPSLTKSRPPRSKPQRSTLNRLSNLTSPPSAVKNVPSQQDEVQSTCQVPPCKRKQQQPQEGNQPYNPCTQINPEPSLNSFRQPKNFGGLHVEISNNQPRLSPSNNTQLTRGSVKQLLC